MKLSYIVICSIMFSCFISAQGKSVVPFPQIGWDSLYKMIDYPNICRRAHIEGEVKAVVKFVDNRDTVSVEVTGDMFVLNEQIEALLKKVKWIPVSSKVPNQDKTFLRFVFLLTDVNQKSFIIETNRIQSPQIIYHYPSGKVDTIPSSIEPQRTIYHPSSEKIDTIR